MSAPLGAKKHGKRILPRLRRICESDPRIDVDQIMPFYDEPVLDQDTDVVDSVLAFRRKTMELTINRLNKIIPTMIEQWPCINPLEAYVAFSMKKTDPDETVYAIKSQEFKDEVKEEVSHLMSFNSDQHPIEAHESEPSDPASDPVSDDIEDIHRKIHSKHHKASYKRPESVPPEVWNSWSEAHQASFLQHSGNSYLYRNVPEGQTQKNGPWSQEEKKLFMKRYKEFKEKGEEINQWGLFSLAIPGRVGYQCANFYRSLLRTGELKDDKYFIDDTGKLRMKTRIHEKEPLPKSKYEIQSENNPLLGSIDAITGEPINVPAISPDGTVLDYNTWMNIFKKGSKDPFSQGVVTRRKLVILTKENIGDFREKIKHI